MLTDELLSYLRSFVHTIFSEFGSLKISKVVADQMIRDFLVHSLSVHRGSCCCVYACVTLDNYVCTNCNI